MKNFKETEAADRLVDLTVAERELLKKNAFLCLQKALLEERYEECSYWVFYAKLSGIGKKEIEYLLQNPHLGNTQAA